MADEVIIAKFTAELDSVKAEFDAYINELEKVKKKEKEVDATTKKTGETAESAAKKRTQAIKAEEAELAKLQKARKLAFDVKDISAFNQKINETKSRIATLKGETAGFGSILKSSLTAFTGGIVAAFSVGAIVNGINEASNAFIEAEENAAKLEFAITQIGKEGEASFQKLIKQSAELQAISIFSDDQIQQAQTALATFGLTSDQIEKLIPRIVDFASATKQDLSTATDTFTKALEGQTRGLIEAGLKFEDTGSRIGNFNVLLESSAKFSGAASQELDTLSGSLKNAKNQAGELEEEIGSGLAPTLTALRLKFLELTKTTLQGLGLIKGINVFQEQAKSATAQIRAEAEASIESLVKNGIAIDKARELTINRLRERLNNEIRAKTGISDEATRVALLKAEADALEQYNAELEKRAADEDRLLTQSELKALSITELNKLLKENQQLTDIIAKDNVDGIKKEIEARKKLQELLDKRTSSEETIKTLKSRSAFKPDEAIDNQKEAEEDFTKFLEEENAKRVGDNEEAAKQIEVSWIDSVLGRYQAEIELTQQFVGTITGLFDQLYNNRIDKIEAQKEKEIEAIDLSLKANEDALDKRRINEVQAENERKKLEADKIKAEKKAQDEINKLKRKQAILDKTAALFQITIDTARNAVEQPGPLGALVPYWIALGAAQAGLVLAKPIPYAKGTKSAKGGLSLVGEQGPELTMLPEGTKVAPARQSRKYAKVFDTMIDDTFDSYILKDFIAPALKKQREEFEMERSRSFADNITKSITVQNGRVDLSSIDRLQRKGMPITNVEDFASAIGRAIQQDPYRR